MAQHAVPLTGFFALHAKGMGGVAVALAAVNIFGGFLVTRRMLAMYKKTDKPAAPATKSGGH